MTLVVLGSQACHSDAGLQKPNFKGPSDRDPVNEIGGMDFGATTLVFVLVLL